MLSIGIDDSRRFVYEGSGRWGWALWPAPYISNAKVVAQSEGTLQPDGQSDSMFGLRFREDSYDPVSRVRRGRFYSGQGQQQPQDWSVQPHPAIPYELREINKNGVVRRSLHTFNSIRLSNYLSDGRQQPLVLLGESGSFTIWTITEVEAVSTGGDLVTLKATGSLGTLPVVNRANVPEAFRGSVTESLEGFVDVVHRSAPASVIHLARDTASQLLLAHFGLDGPSARDLGKLATRLRDQGQLIASSAAEIINRLHSRAKPSEKARRSLRPIREQDAELARQCVGTILCELGWADWA